MGKFGFLEDPYAIAMVGSVNKGNHPCTVLKLQGVQLTVDKESFFLYLKSTYTTPNHHPHHHPSHTGALCHPGGPHEGQGGGGQSGPVQGDVPGQH